MWRMFFAIAVCAGTIATPAMAAGDAAAQTPMAPRACPATVADVAVCYGGRDPQGSYLVAAIPRAWNRQLIVHAHGGPRMTTPAPDDSIEDLTRFAVMVRAGYAWVGASYRRGDFGARRAAADVEQSRRAFVGQFGAPLRTVLHGQSWGAQIALKVLELYGRDEQGRLAYDAALLTNGVVAGAVEAYQFRAELRAVFQYYCANHPGADEPPYPVWMGLPPGMTMSREAVSARLDACTGLNKTAAQRTPAERQRLADILAATGIQERALRTHLNWATSTMSTLIAGVGGGNPFDNSATVYGGVSDPAALNAGVARFRADPKARALLDYDTKPTGLVVAPVLSVFAQGDAQVSPRLQDHLAATFAAAGRADWLVQIGLRWEDHSNLPDDVLAAALVALDGWVVHGTRPNRESLRALCAQQAQPCASLP